MRLLAQIWSSPTSSQSGLMVCLSCLDDVSELYPFSAGCGHRFCKTCSDTLTNTNACPVCKASASLPRGMLESSLDWEPHESITLVNETAHFQDEPVSSKTALAYFELQKLREVSVPGSSRNRCSWGSLIIWVCVCLLVLLGVTTFHVSFAAKEDRISPENGTRGAEVSNGHIQHDRLWNCESKPVVNDGEAEVDFICQNKSSTKHHSLQLRHSVEK